MAIPSEQLTARDEVVSILRRRLSSTSQGLSALPSVITGFIRDGMWRKRRLKGTGEVVTFDSFAEFVTAPPLKGLGSTVKQLRAICQGDPQALDAIERATARKRGGRHVITNTISNERQTRQGTSSAQALRRLRKDRPDLHARVLAGELTPHAAMIEAGFRRPTATVPVTIHGAVRLLGRLSESDRSEVARSMGWQP